MTDLRPLRNDLQHFELTEPELVQCQQLNILRYWGERMRGEAPGLPIKLETFPIGSPAVWPERWSLLQGVELRGWQTNCVDHWFRAGKRGVVKVVTGAGKTVFACGIIERLQNTEAPDLRVAIVVPTVVLLDQWYVLLTSGNNLPPGAVGRLGGGYQDKIDSVTRILVCVLNSASAKLPKLASQLGTPLLLVVDECHRAGAKQMSEIFQCRRTFNLGLSATPERDAEPGPDEDDAIVDKDPDEPENFDDTLLGRELGPIIFELGYLDALKDGILSRFQVQHYGLALEPQERVQYERMSREIRDLRRSLQSQMRGRGMDGGALVGWARKMAAKGASPLSSQAAKYVTLTGQRKQLIYRATARALAVERLVQEALLQGKQARILLFHESVAEVMRLFDRLRRLGIPVVAEHSKLPDGLRAESLQLFRSGAAQVLVSARSLIEGFDVPAADVGIVVASSSSVRQRVQTLGRILRKKPGEDRAAILHVLYMAETTDEMIYEKQDWAAVTGAERNRYFVWDPTQSDSKPQERDQPPRKVKPSEAEVDWASLVPGGDYPGVYEGAEFAADAQGNVKNADGLNASNPQQVPKRVQEIRGAFGRFRVTPQNRAVLVPTGESGRVVFADLLVEPFRFESASNSDTADGSLELFVKTKASGYRIAIKIHDGEAFARTGGQSTDPARGKDAENLALRVKELERVTGKTIRKLRLFPNREVATELDGTRHVLLTLSVGLEFADRLLP